MFHHRKTIRDIKTTVKPDTDKSPLKINKGLASTNQITQTFKSLLSDISFVSLNLVQQTTRQAFISEQAQKNVLKEDLSTCLHAKEFYCSRQSGLSEMTIRKYFTSFPSAWLLF